MEIRLRLDPPRGPLAVWAAKGDHRIWWRPADPETSKTGLIVADEADMHRVLRLIDRGARHERERLGVEDGRMVLAYRCACGGRDDCGLAHPALTALGAWGFPDHRVDGVHLEGGQGVARVTFPDVWGDTEEALVAEIVAADDALRRHGATLSELVPARDRLWHQARRAWGRNPLEVETLDVAFRAGYYAKPRGCTMDDLGARLGVSKSAVYHRLNRAVRSAVAAYLEEHLGKPRPKNPCDDTPRRRVSPWPCRATKAPAG